MTAGELQAINAQAAEATQHYRGMTDQARLIGHVANHETFGLPDCDAHLIAKLRNMDPDQLAIIRGTGKEPQ